MLRLWINDKQQRAFIHQLERINPRVIQRELVLPAMHKMSPIYRSALKQVILQKTGSKTSRNRLQLHNTVFAKAYGKPAYAPNVAFLVGTRFGTRVQLRNRTSTGNVAAGERLNFLGGTKRRVTRKGANRGRMQNYFIREATENKARGAAGFAFQQEFKRRAGHLFLFKRHLAG